MSTLPGDDDKAIVSLGGLVNGPHGRAISEAIRKHVAECAARRARVLKYEDLAERLTHPPLRLSAPERWMGYVPPKHGPWGAGGSTAENDSPFRRQLIEISAEAYRRDVEAA